MAIRINNQDYLNYEEQVLKNKKDVEELMLKLRNVSKYGLDKVNMYVSLNAARGTEDSMRFNTILNLSYKVRNYKITFTPMFEGNNTDDTMSFKRIDGEEPLANPYTTIEAGYLYTLSYEDTGEHSASTGKLIITKDGIESYNSSNILAFHIEYGDLIGLNIKSIELW